MEIEKDKGSELLLKKGYRELERIKSLKTFLSKHVKYPLGSTGRTDSVRESIRLIFLYINAVSQNRKNFNEIFDRGFLLDIHEGSSIDQILSHLILLEDIVNSYIDSFEYDVKPHLSSNEKKILSELREDLEKLKEEGLEPKIFKNLKMALEELEKPNYLSCAMISARSTLGIIEGIKTRSKNNNDEEKVNVLRDLGVIDRGELSNQTVKFFLESIHSARNLVLHEIGYFPDYTDANNFLTSSFKIAKLYNKYRAKI